MISIIILNVPNLTISIKWQQVIKWLKKDQLCGVYEKLYQFNYIGRLKVKGWKSIYHANISPKKKKKAE